MTKPEMVNRIAQKTGMTQKQAAAALAAITTTITDILKNGDKIAISNLGTFSLKERAARKGKNPRTGEAIEIAAKKVPGFKPAKALKDAVE